jgi:hypothetical protein
MDNDFMSKNNHLNDRDLLLAADAELSLFRSAGVRAHLEKCPSCRSRMLEFQQTLAEVSELHRETLNPQSSCASVPRAVLRARLAELAADESGTGSWWKFLQLPSVMQATAITCVLCLFAMTAAKALFPRFELRGAATPAVALNHTVIPDRHLTPGAARTVSLGEVCAMAHEDVERQVSVSVRDRVFQEYGIANARSADYEIDYLIAPGLGGTEDIHNLWPEPYNSQTWNARVKDSLEEHLHELVCAGKVDLPTAQKDIATDWIAAYKKYFHTDRPVDERVASFSVGSRTRAKLGLS